MPSFVFRCLAVLALCLLVAPACSAGTQKGLIPKVTHQDNPDPNDCPQLSPGPARRLDASTLTQAEIDGIGSQRVTLWTSDEDAATLARYFDRLKCNLVDLDATAVRTNGQALDLSNLTRLETLNLQHIEMDTVVINATLPALQIVDGWSSRVNITEGLRDISALRHAPKLRYLFLEQTRVEDISVLSDLSELRRLDLTETFVSDLTPISGLHALRVLALIRAPVASLDPLADLHQLHTLYADHTAITSLEPLRGLESLRVLSVASTEVASLAPLSETRLVQLSIKGTQVSDLSPLYEMHSLELLLVKGSKVSEEALRHLKARLPKVKFSADFGITAPIRLD